ncbi:MAG: hypothetical protein PUP91_18420 [Rhizonema sp. PD37]|nr:hypothetical protein [Rhizonema sp. PD37]
MPKHSDGGKMQNLGLQPRKANGIFPWESSSLKDAAKGEVLRREVSLRRASRQSTLSGRLCLKE